MPAIGFIHFLMEYRPTHSGLSVDTKMEFCVYNHGSYQQWRNRGLAFSVVTHVNRQGVSIVSLRRPGSIAPSYLPYGYTNDTDY